MKKLILMLIFQIYFIYPQNKLESCNIKLKDEDNCVVVIYDEFPATELKIIDKDNFIRYSIKKVEGDNFIFTSNYNKKISFERKIYKTIISEDGDINVEPTENPYKYEFILKLNNINFLIHEIEYDMEGNFVKSSLYNKREFMNEIQNFKKKIMNYEVKSDELENFYYEFGLSKYTKEIFGNINNYNSDNTDEHKKIKIEYNVVYNKSINDLKLLKN